MRLGLVVTSPLVLLLFLNDDLRNTATAQEKQTSTLTEILSTVITELPSKVSIHSTVSAVDSEKRSSTMVVVTSLEVQVSSSKSFQVSSTTSKQEKSVIANLEKERSQSIPVVSKKPDEFMVTKSLSKPERSTVLLEGVGASTKAKTISASFTKPIPVRKSTLSSPIPVQSSVFSNMHTANTTDLNKNIASFISAKHSKFAVQTTTSPEPKASLHVSVRLEIPSSKITEKRQDFNLTISVVPTQKFDSTQASTGTMAKEMLSKMYSVKDEDVTTKISSRSLPYTQTGQITTVSKSMPEIPHIQANSTTRISSVEYKRVNGTFVLEPSPSLVTKQPPSKINLVFTSALETEKLPNQTISTIKNESKTGIMESLSKFKPLNLTKSTVFREMYKKTFMSTPKQLVSSTDVHVTINIDVMTSRTMTGSETIVYGKLNKTEMHTPSSISNQTRIQDISDNSTSYGFIKAPSRLPTYSETVTSRTKDIEVLSSPTIAKKSQENDTTYSMRELGVSKRSEEIKATATLLYSTTQKISLVTSRPPIISQTKKQQFRVIFRITNRQYKKEYTTNTSLFRQKSKEIISEFERAFKNMPEYLYTEVVKFFSGSLGCEVIIHTKSKESEPVTVDKLQDTLDQAMDEDEFKFFDVPGGFDIKEESPDVQGRDDDEEDDKTWGRWPIVVISILGGVCFVLFVIVITQCIQKRHYSHSLAESNDIQQWSPNIQLKNHDESVCKDEERLPMTTFNQTDIY